MAQNSRLSSGRVWLILAAMTTPLSLILLDSSILPVAFPTIQQEMLASPAKINWMLNAYLLSYASLVLGASKMCNRWGNRRGFCLGMISFALGSTVGALSWTADVLVLARIIQGFGSAFMAPAALAIIVDTFPPTHRGRAIGISVSISSVFCALGPVIGGFTTEFLTWRFLFWVNLPIVIFGVVMTLIFVPKSKQVYEPYHIPGFLCLLFGILCLTIGLMQGRVWGWTSIQVLFLLASSVLFFSLLVITSRFVKVPFINISLFKHPVYFAGITILFGTQFLMTNAFFWPILFQKIWAYTPFYSGLIILLSTLPPIIASPLGGYISDRIGPKIPVLSGIAFFILSFLLLILFSQNESTKLLIFALLSFGFGVGFVMTPVGSTALSHIPESKRMLATGFYSTVRFTGGTLGVAALGAIKSNVKYLNFSTLMSSLPAVDNIEHMELIRSVAQKTNVLESGAQLSTQLSSKLHACYVHASINAFVYMNIASIFVAFCIFILAFKCLKPYHNLAPSGEAQSLGSESIESISSP